MPFIFMHSYIPKWSSKNFVKGQNETLPGPHCIRPGALRPTWCTYPYNSVTQGIVYTYIILSQFLG